MEINSDLIKHTEGVIEKDKKIYINVSNFVKNVTLSEETVLLNQMRLSPCPSNYLNRKLDEIADLDTSNLTKPEHSKGKELLSLSCILGSFFYSLSTGVTGVYKYLFLKNIRGIKKIGAESVYGTVLSLDFGGSDNLFVVKISNFETDEEFSHELYTGLLLDSIIEDAPNFAYTYGGFDCTAFLNFEGNISGLCGNSPEKRYIALENIDNSVTLKQYLEVRPETDEVISLFLQMTMSLFVANEKLGFTHNDLHTNNIML